MQLVSRTIVANYSDKLCRYIYKMMPSLVPLSLQDNEWTQLHNLIDVIYKELGGVQGDSPSVEFDL